jgi:hypothetical protein
MTMAASPDPDRPRPSELLSKIVKSPLNLASSGRVASALIQLVESSDEKKIEY